MVPTAEAYPSEAADNVGDNIVEVELATIGKEALQKLGADTKDHGADNDSQMERTAAVRVDYPVEDYC
jgi:hypothetical protein